MNCGQRQELMLPYLAGSLDESETVEMRRHLAEGCPSCIGALAEARATLQHLPFLLDPVSPDEGARDRLFKRLPTATPQETKPEPVDGSDGNESSERAFRWRPVGLAAACAVLAFGATYALMSVRIHETEQEIAALQGGITELEEKASGMERIAEEFRRASKGFEEFMGVLQSSALEVVSLQGAESNPDAWGRLFWDRERNVCHVVTRSLSPAEEGRTYRLWFETEDEQRFAGGEFDVDESGNGVLSISIPEDLPQRLRMSISYGPQDSPEESDGPILLGAISF